MILLFHLIPYKASGINDISPRILYLCAEVLFRPFHHLFTISLRYGLIQTGWKVNKVAPVFKAGNPSFVKDYFPISLLSNISKKLECLVFN